MAEQTLAQWYASEASLGDGHWLVHRHGANRPSKLPVRFMRREHAEAVALVLNEQARVIERVTWEAVFLTIEDVIVDTRERGCHTRWNIIKALRARAAALGAPDPIPSRDT